VCVSVYCTALANGKWAQNKRVARDFQVGEDEWREQCLSKQTQPGQTATQWRLDVAHLVRRRNYPHTGVSRWSGAPHLFNLRDIARSLPKVRFSVIRPSMHSLDSKHTQCKRTYSIEGEKLSGATNLFDCICADKFSVSPVAFLWSFPWRCFASWVHSRNEKDVAQERVWEFRNLSFFGKRTDPTNFSFTIKRGENLLLC